MRLLLLDASIVLRRLARALPLVRLDVDLVHEYLGPVRYAVVGEGAVVVVQLRGEGVALDAVVEGLQVDVKVRLALKRS